MSLEQKRYDLSLFNGETHLIIPLRSNFVFPGNLTLIFIFSPLLKTFDVTIPAPLLLKSTSSPFSLSKNILINVF